MAELAVCSRTRVSEAKTFYCSRDTSNGAGAYIISLKRPKTSPISGQHSLRRYGAPPPPLIDHDLQPIDCPLEMSLSVFRGQTMADILLNGPVPSATPIWSTWMPSPSLLALLKWPPRNVRRARVFNIKMVPLNVLRNLFVTYLWAASLPKPDTI